jgi:hypothetical protein
VFRVPVAELQGSAQKELPSRRQVITGLEVVVMGASANSSAPLQLISRVLVSIDRVEDADRVVGALSRLYRIAYDLDFFMVPRFGYRARHVELDVGQTGFAAEIQITVREMADVHEEALRVRRRPFSVSAAALHTAREGQRLNVNREVANEFGSALDGMLRATGCARLVSVVVLEVLMTPRAVSSGTCRIVSDGVTAWTEIWSTNGWEPGGDKPDELLADEPSGKTSGPMDASAEIARRVDEILTGYVRIHDAIFKFSMRRLFKRIEYSSYRDRLDLLVVELDSLERKVRGLSIADGWNRETEFLETLRQYISALTYAIGKLSHLCEYLEAISNASPGSLQHFRSEKEKYDDAVRSYADLGRRLSSLYREIYGEGRTR